MDGTGGYDKGQVLRNEDYARPLVPFEHRLDMSKLNFLVRNDRIGLWAQEVFPRLRNITWANPAWLSYGPYAAFQYNSLDDVDSEDTASYEDEEEELDEDDD
jgi:hypothetical protein